MQSRTICFLAAALLVGCGGGGPKTDADRISQTLKDTAKAVAARDSEKVCSHLTPAAQQQVVALGGAAAGGTNCPFIVTVATGALAPLDRKQIEDAQPQNIVVTGSTATADVVIPSATNQLPPIKVSLQKTPGSWLIASFSNLPN